MELSENTWIVSLFPLALLRVCACAFAGNLLLEM